MVSKYIQSEMDQLDSNYDTWLQLKGTMLGKTYYNKILVRKDYAVNTPEGKAMADTIQKKFPNYAEWARTRNPNNSIGEHGAYRKPYKNHSITWYDSDIVSEDILSRFKVECDRSKLSHDSIRFIAWYAYKFDLVTDEVMLKVGYNHIPYDKPQALQSLPSGRKAYYGITYKEDGTVCDLINCYIFETKSNMKKFCEDYGLKWPLPDGISDDDIFLYDVIFNRHTLELDSTKVYTLYK